jgi:hypothetical protein
MLDKRPTRFCMNWVEEKQKHSTLSSLSSSSQGVDGRKDFIVQNFQIFGLTTRKPFLKQQS